jgi:putative ABC transport system permease protein
VQEAEDIESLRGVGGVNQVAPVITSSLTCKAGINTYDTTVYGTTEGYDTIRNYTLSSGRFITASDVENRNSVCVIRLSLCSMTGSLSEVRCGPTLGRLLVLALNISDVL